MLQNREAVVGCDAQGCITVINSAAGRFLGLPAEGLEGCLAESGLDPAGSDTGTPGQEVRDEALMVVYQCPPVGLSAALPYTDTLCAAGRHCPPAPAGP